MLSNSNHIIKHVFLKKLDKGNICRLRLKNLFLDPICYFQCNLEYL